MNHPHWIFRVAIVAVVLAVVEQVLHAYMDKQGVRRKP